MNLTRCKEIAERVLVAPENRPDWVLDFPAAENENERYYRFLWDLALEMKPAFTVEIGTRCGTSAVSLAGASDGIVVTVDIDENCIVGFRQILSNLAVKGHSLPNLRTVIAESHSVNPSVFVTQPIDLLFIDGDHSYHASYGDYLNYRPFVRDGGIIVFDDTRLNHGMSQAWDRIIDDKLELPELHYMGFGVIQKRAEREPLAR